jgi:hypothetical protein
VVRGVTEEEATSGARWKLMWSGGRSVGIAGTAEHAKVVVGGGCAVQGKVGSGVAHRLRGEAVEEMCGGVQGLCLVAGREGRLEEKAADHVGGGANDLFGPGILGRGVRARETQLDAMGEKEGSRGVVVELAAIVTLEGTDRETELGGDPGKEVGEGGERVGLQPEGESPKKMWVVVQNDQVVFVAREAEDKRIPEITMDKIKGLNSPGRESGKRKTGVTAELTSMTEALRWAPSIGYVWAAGKLGHHVRSRVPEATVPNGGGGGGSSKSMWCGGSSKSRRWGYSGGGSGGQVKRIEGARAVRGSDHSMCEKVAYGESPGVKLHRTVVVTSEATNREKGMSQTGSNKDVVKAEWSWKNRCTYWGDREGRTVSYDDGGSMWGVWWMGVE